MRASTMAAMGSLPCLHRASNCKCRWSASRDSNKSHVLIECSRAISSSVYRLEESSRRSVCADLSAIATLCASIQSLSIGSECLCFAKRDSQLYGDTSSNKEAEVERPFDEKVQEGDDEQAEQILHPASSFPLEKDVGWGLSEDDLQIIEAERLRRQRISLANKNKAPWNKGKGKGKVKVKKHEPGTQSSGAAINHTMPKGMENGVEILFKEKQRRQRLAAALAGRTSWNNGKKHSAETRLRITERTLEAMKNSKVRDKLRVPRSFMSKETKLKIKVSMARVWEKREKLKLIQESCVEEWKELVANGARIGFVGDTTHNWNSYDTILRELQYAWRLKTKSCSCKDPKARMTSALRIKVSDEVVAERTDINYRMPMEAALCSYQEQQDSGMTKLRRRTQKTAEGMSDSSERVLKVFESVENDRASKLSRDSAVEALSQSGQPIQRIVNVQQSKPMRKSLPAKKNNLTHERLERLKQIRAIRRTKANDKTKAFKESSQERAVEKARVLMKEAQIAARELEAQAARDKSAMRSLQAAQQLLSEAQALLKAAGLEE
ncbi:hypothetical protein L7F22_003393 [Adiantum nelumboides]|nr:hypothetical protein [Adiantum nelumboides]